MERRAGLAVLFVVASAQAACASANVVEPGLANAPVLPATQGTEVHDAIANGHDSCPRARVAAGDPLRFRYPPCPGRGEPTTLNAALLAVPIRAADPGDGVWNLHLDGLPPCDEDATSADASGRRLAMCRTVRVKAVGADSHRL